MLHACNVCDRRFKKQSDRDRHLYVHNVRVEHAVHICELCGYEAAKQIHLDGHFAKVDTSGCAGNGVVCTGNGAVCTGSRVVCMIPKISFNEL